jgi:adenylosuccinate lyase
MPHKKNPISAENMTGLARLIRANSLAAMENMALWHERDISHSSVERVIMPDSTILMDYILHRLANLLEHLHVLPENMARNLKLSHGLFFSQKVLLALMDKGNIPRQTAYEHIQALAMRSWQEGLSFPELVRGDPLIRKHLTDAALAALFDPAAYLVHEQAIYDRIFGDAASAPENRP